MSREPGPAPEWRRPLIDNVGGMKMFGIRAMNGSPISAISTSPGRLLTGCLGVLVFFGIISSATV
jgi:hypothetical protein